MGVRTTAQWLDQEVTYVPNSGSSLGFRVIIADVKAVYGDYHFRIVPMNGGGSAWVKRSSLVGLFTVDAAGQTITDGQ